MREVSIDNFTIERNVYRPRHDSLVGDIAASAWQSIRENSEHRSRLVMGGNSTDASASGEISMNDPYANAACEKMTGCQNSDAAAEASEHGPHRGLRAAALRHLIRDHADEHGNLGRPAKIIIGRHLAKYHR